MIAFHFVKLLLRADVRIERRKVGSVVFIFIIQFGPIRAYVLVRVPHLFVGSNRQVTGLLAGILWHGAHVRLLTARQGVVSRQLLHADTVLYSYRQGTLSTY